MTSGNHESIAVPLLERIEASVTSRLSKGMYVHLGSTAVGGVDFSSNDYLSLSHVGSDFQAFLKDSALMQTPMPTSSTGSRVLSGNSTLAARIEKLAAEFHQGEAALLFNSGFDANIALMSCLLGPEDIFLYDALVHASMHDGMKLSRAKHKPIPFAHNSVESLRNTIAIASQKVAGNIVVLVETVYSMDGDACPLDDMLDVCSRLSDELNRDIYMIADEAHSGGIFGVNGEGYVFEKKLHHHPNLLARVMTFGKAYASHGAVIVCPQVLKEYLHNYGRSFIFSTSMDPHSLAVIHEMYRFMQTDQAKVDRDRLWKNVELFKSLASKHLPSEMLLPDAGHSPIQVVLVGSVKRGLALHGAICKAGYDTSAVAAPVVPRGHERIRIIVHQGNTEEEIEGLIMTIANWVEEYEG